MHHSSPWSGGRSLMSPLALIKPGAVATWLKWAWKSDCSALNVTEIHPFSFQAFFVLKGFPFPNSFCGLFPTWTFSQHSHLACQAQVLPSTQTKNSSLCFTHFLLPFFWCPLIFQQLPSAFASLVAPPTCPKYKLYTGMKRLSTGRHGGVTAHDALYL